MIKILYIASILSILTYSLWNYIPIDYFFYYGNSIFICLLCIYIFFTDKQSNIKFILFALSVNNLLDELFFDNTKFELNEILFFLAIIVLTRFRNGR